MKTANERLFNLLEEIGLDYDVLEYVFEGGVKDYDVDTLYEKLYDEGAFDYEFIYLKEAQNYLFENDGDLSESLKIAYDLGFSTQKLDIYALAFLHYQRKCQDAYYEHKGEIETLLNEIKKE